MSFPPSFPKSPNCPRGSSSPTPPPSCLLTVEDVIRGAHSTSKSRYLEENVAAAHVQLTPDEAARIRARVENAAAGDKWPESMALGLFADTPLP